MKYFIPWLSTDLNLIKAETKPRFAEVIYQDLVPKRSFASDTARKL